MGLNSLNPLRHTTVSGELTKNVRLQAFMKNEACKNSTYQITYIK